MIWAKKVMELPGTGICEKSVFSSVQSLSRVRLLATPWTAAHQASLTIIINSWSLPKLVSNELVMPSNHFILCRPLLLLPSIFSQHQGLFQWVSSLHQVAKVLEFSFSISRSNDYSGLISFRMDWLDLLAAQRTIYCLDSIITFCYIALLNNCSSLYLPINLHMSKN